MSILIDRDTTLIVQGITGREAVNLTRECIDYGAGAKVVGGVTPGRKGRDVHGVPVFDTVAQAVERHGGPIEGSVVTVPPAFTKDAVFEAIENGIELVVIVTERIPRADVAQPHAAGGTEAEHGAGLGHETGLVLAGGLAPPGPGIAEDLDAGHQAGEGNALAIVVGESAVARRSLL